MGSGKNELISEKNKDIRTKCFDKFGKRNVNKKEKNYNKMSRFYTHLNTCPK